MTTIKQRRGTAAQWASANPVLAAGEPGFETDTGNHKIGDGATAWNSLLPANHATYVPLAGGTMTGLLNLHRDGQAIDGGGNLTDTGTGATLYRITTGTGSGKWTGGTNGPRGDSVASDAADGAGATFFNGFYANNIAGAFDDKGVAQLYAFYGEIDPYSGGGAVYGEIGGVVGAITNKRTGARAEGFEAAINSGGTGAGIEGRNAAYVAVMNEYAAIANYWRRGFWAASQGDHPSGDAYYADGAAGWTNFLRCIGTDGVTQVAMLRADGVFQTASDITARQGGNATSIGQQGPSGEAGIAMLDAVIYRSGAATMQIGSTAGQKIVTGFAGGSIGFYGHAAVAQPAAPVTLADVIAVIRGCGLSA